MPATQILRVTSTLSTTMTKGGEDVDGGEEGVLTTGGPPLQTGQAPTRDGLPNLGM